MLHVTIAGRQAAPPLVITHDLGECAAAMADAVRRFSTTFRVYAIDLLGHGLSPRLTANQIDKVFESSVTQLKKTIGSLGFDQPPLFYGHSLGAALGTAIAARHRSAFTAMVLEDPAWLSSEQRSRHARAAQARINLTNRAETNPEELLADHDLISPDWAMTERIGIITGHLQVDPNFLRTGVTTFPEPWQELASTIRIPTLVHSSDSPEAYLGQGGIAAVDLLDNPYLTTKLSPGFGHDIRRAAPDTFHRGANAFFNGVVAV